MIDYIPPALGLPFAALLWATLVFMWFRKPLLIKLDNYFAHRRHIRRVRRRQERAFATYTAAKQAFVTPTR